MLIDRDKSAPIAGQPTLTRPAGRGAAKCGDDCVDRFKRVVAYHQISALDPRIFGNHGDVLAGKLLCDGACDALREIGQKSLLSGDENDFVSLQAGAIVERKSQLHSACSAADHCNPGSFRRYLQPCHETVDGTNIEQARISPQHGCSPTDAARIDRCHVEIEAFARTDGDAPRIGVNCHTMIQYQAHTSPLCQPGEVNKTEVTIILARDPARHRPRISQRGMRRKQRSARTVFGTRQAVLDPVGQHRDMRMPAPDQQEVLRRQLFCLPSISRSTSDGSASVEVSPNEP